MLNLDFLEVIKKGAVALIIRIIGFLSGYLFIYFTVKYFGAETQGRLSLSFSIMIIGALLCRLGVDVNFVKIFAIKDNIGNAKGIYFKILPLIAILTLVVSLCIFIGADFLSSFIFNDKSLSPFIKWTSPCPFLYTLILINAAVLRGLKKNAMYSFLFNGGRFLFTVLFFFILIIVVSKNPLFTIIAHTASITVLFILSFIAVWKHLAPISRHSNYRIKPFLKESFPMLFSASMIVFLGWSDTIILGMYRESEVVGVYSVVLKIAAVTSFTFQALDSILAPKLSTSFHNNDMKSFKMLVKYSTLLNLLISVLVVASIIIFRDLILSFFGEGFFIASTALIILCIGQLFNAICGPVGSILQMTGYQKAFQNILLVALLINITLNLILIKPYGVTGVAVATACSLAFWNVTSVFYIRKKIY